MRRERRLVAAANEGYQEASAKQHLHDAMAARGRRWRACSRKSCATVELKLVIQSPATSQVPEAREMTFMVVGREGIQREQPIPVLIPDSEAAA